YRFGLPGDTPIAGDWDGNGTDSFGIYRMPWFAVTNASGGPTTYTRYGQAGDRPITGDWNGDHSDTVGIGRDY
ncbi:MAG: cell surface protein, partial [Actinobacteria bacterium]|nr:cell surface protein [Actinomycetota bacterium]